MSRKYASTLENPPLQTRRSRRVRPLKSRPNTTDVTPRFTLVLPESPVLPLDRRYHAHRDPSSPAFGDALSHVPARCICLKGNRSEIGRASPLRKMTSTAYAVGQDSGPEAPAEGSRHRVLTNAMSVAPRPRGALLSAEGVDADVQSRERRKPWTGGSTLFPWSLTRTNRNGSRTGPREEWNSCGERLSNRVSGMSRRPPRSLKEGRIDPSEAGLAPPLLQCAERECR